MDNRLNHANAHAISARATRNLPIISAAHHRALQFILSAEADDSLLTPLQRGNARTLQQHYHQQYLETCLFKTLSPSDNNPTAGTTDTVSNSSRGILDRVKSRVDEALEKKRKARGFVSAITPNESNMDEYRMCLEDLASLSCEPDMDILSAPESLELLKERATQYKAEDDAVAAKAAKAEELRSAQKELKSEDVSMSDSPKSSGSPAQHHSPQAAPASGIIVKQGDVAGSPKHEDYERTRTEERVVNGNRNILRNIRNPLTSVAANNYAQPPSTAIPQTMRPKYAVYGDEEDDDDRADPVPVPDYKPAMNFLDHPKKRTWSDRSDGPADNSAKTMHFITAKEQMAIEEQQNEEKRANHFQNRGGFNAPMHNPYINNNTSGGSGGYGSTNTNGNMNAGMNGPGAAGNTLKSKMLGTKRPKFRSPINRDNSMENGDEGTRTSQARGTTNKSDEPVDERLRNIDPKMVEAINNEIMESLPIVAWEDISGLEHAKKTIKETITWPMLRPDIFTGLRRPPKGLLLFGPPGTGKTMIGKCIASQSKATFFSISSSSLTSKWIGDGEKMVRALFAVARCHQPAVIFMDEIDSLLTQRSDGEVEASRRIKTEFLVQFDGVGVGGEEDRILIVGATNRPQEIDEAARRRFQKRLYIPLPESQGRHGLITRLLEKQPHDMTPEQILDICERTAGYSGSDMTGLCREAALGPVRAIQGDILEIGLDALRPINHCDFVEALSQVRASVSDRDLDLYKKWDMEYGSIAKG